MTNVWSVTTIIGVLDKPALLYSPGRDVLEAARRLEGFEA